MKKLDLCKLLESSAKDYRLDCNDSVNNNCHMNELNVKQCIDQRNIDAILVDFINFIANEQGIDLGLYVKDLKGERNEDKTCYNN